MAEQNKKNQRPDAVPASLSVGSVEPKYKKGDHVWAKQPKELAGRTGYVMAVDTYRMMYEVTFGTEIWKMLEDDIELVDPATEEARQTVFERKDDADQPLLISPSPVFVSAYDIAHYDGPETEPDNAGRMTITALHGETPKGYRCPDIEAFYMWEPNGPGKGFTQSLTCRFHGSEPHFNHMLRFMCRRKAEYVILLPRPKKPFLFVGGSMTDIEIEGRSVEHQTFVMKYGCCIEPLPYYDGPLDIEDCTEPELMKKIY